MGTMERSEIRCDHSTGKVGKMSKHVWNVQRLSRETTQRGLYAYCLARNGGRDPHQTDSPKGNASGLNRLDALRFAGYAMETLRQTGGRQDSEHPYWPGWVRDIWRGATWSHHRYAQGRNAKGYELAGCKMLAAVIRSMYGWTRAGSDEQLEMLPAGSPRLPGRKPPRRVPVGTRRQIWSAFLWCDPTETGSREANQCQ
jgi:hypothetical protein